MANYNQVSRGSGDKKTVMTLQEKLNEHGAGLQVDGIFGPATDKALRNYQTKNGLQVDGIAGGKTWASLMSGSNAGAQQTTQPTQQAAPVAAEPEKVYRYEYEKDPLYQAADQKVQDMEGTKPTIQGTYDQQVEQLFQELQGQKEFTYDLNGDALWQQYKDQYTTQGKLAMMDAMGQAAALTGGYGSSYAQGVGQQAYQGYLQQMNDRVPELYQLALQKYNNDQALLKDKFTIAKGMQADEYSKDMDKLNLWYQDLDIARDDLHTAYEQGSSEWYTGEQLRREDENTEYTRKENNYNKLANLIATTGHIPTQEELAAAGMSAAQANALAAAYEREQRSNVAGNNEVKPTIDYKNMGYSSYNEMAEALSQIAREEGDGALRNKLEEYVAAGYLDEESFVNLYVAYSGDEDSKPVTSIMSKDDWIRRTGSALGYDVYLKQNGINLA